MSGGDFIYKKWREGAGERDRNCAFLFTRSGQKSRLKVKNPSRWKPAKHTTNLKRDIERKRGVNVQTNQNS